MAELFASGRIVDLILALTLIEALVLWLRHRWTGRGPAPARLLPTLAAGVFLLLALRLALTGAPWPWLGTSLAAAGLCHLLDLRARRQSF